MDIFLRLYKCFADQFISPYGRFIRTFRQQIERIALLLAPADKCIGTDTVQFNMNVLVNTHQIKFPVFHIDLDFSRKIGTGELPEIFL